jgi:hypothetical protein
MNSTIVGKIEEALRPLIGLQLFKAWNIFATRLLYFATPGEHPTSEDGDYRITLECPWRIEQEGCIIVGSEDYGLRASTNLDPAWDPTEMQWGHRQDEKLVDLLGESRNGVIFNTGIKLVVESLEGDAFGGFRLYLSGGYTLGAFPTTDGALEWLLSPRQGASISWTNGNLSLS